MSSMRVFYSGWEECEAGHFFGPAIRHHYLMHIILKGRGFYQASGHTYTLGKGQAFLIYPEEITYYQADKKEPWIYAWVSFDGPDVEKLLDQTCFRMNRYVSPAIIRDRDVKKIQDLLSAFHQHDSNPIDLEGCFYRVLALFYGETEKGTQQYERRYYEKAVEYIEQNYGYPLKIGDLAGYVGIDRTYLYKIFMEFAKCAPKQYLQQFRLKEAMGMLSEGKFSVTEAAYSCGFHDAAAFCHVMKKKTGMTPLEFQASQTMYK
ncbi:AraC family transcriptional regulator [Lachnoclostridium phytofermentans]|uniref:Transcriptional regulator, AraC family n=1 Tax=Lachnoclostridium phytofermentans (strain ATCC 700394 / DSM 18823 / ISDg) TaxID=357809 RepID=A9KKI4_LACP7|nr:AraC family transcriptional regulator [Lachnoclostridium phytofermentans]ABX41155.1 transcriptional regulator, AraC family [Lachnoclostridium phytofermentans ISDg]